MKLTIIPVDSRVSIDGVVVEKVDLSNLDESIHAIQWDGKSGWIEYKDTRPNQPLGSIEDFLWVVDRAQHVLANPEKIPPEVDFVQDTLVKNFGVLKLAVIKNILDAVYEGFATSPVFNNAGEIVGVKTITTTSDGLNGSAAFQLKKLTDDCLYYGVPFIAELNPTTVSLERFVQFFQTIGYTVVTNEGKTYVHTPVDLKLAKNYKKRLIDLNRDTKLVSGFVWNNTTFDSDLASRQNLTEVVNAIFAGYSLPDGFVWRAKDNSAVQVTTDNLKDMYAAMIQFVSDKYAEAWAKKASVDTASTIEEVNAVE